MIPGVKKQFEIVKGLLNRPDVDTIVVPIGGGGLASGVASAVKMLHPNVRVIGVQAAGAAGMKASIEAGHVVSLDTAKTIADGIAVKKPGELTFALCSKYLDEIVTVDDDESAARWSPRARAPRRSPPL